MSTNRENGHRTPEENQHEDFDNRIGQNDDNKVVDQVNVNMDLIHKPLVVLFGPTQIGKTMVLLRLLKYLQNSGDVSFKLNEGFVNEGYYEDVVERFRQSIYLNNTVADATSATDFLLINITKDEEKFCQILEAPGEHYFDLQDQLKTTFPIYLTRMFSNEKVKKIFLFFFEEKLLKDSESRVNYANRVAQVILQANKNDKIIFLFNKVDEVPELTIGGKVNPKALKDIIFDNPSYAAIPKAIKKNRKNIKNIRWVPFSSGQPGERDTFAIGDDKYPKLLWKSIEDSIIPSGCLWI